MRFFIALEVPQSSRDQLKAVQHNIKEIIPEAKLTDSDKLHITIAFIGEHPEGFKDKLSDVIERAVEGIEPFTLTPAFLDGFPSIHHPETLWVGVKGDIDKLFVIRERIKDGLFNLRLLVDERRFVPHIAIAKFRDYRTPEDIEHELQSMIFGEFDPIAVSSIKLFESVPDEGFHKHNTLAEIPLI